MIIFRLFSNRIKNYRRCNKMKEYFPVESKWNKRVSSILQSSIHWLSQLHRPPKYHTSLIRPLVVCIVHYVLSTAFIVAFHDHVFLHFFELIQRQPLFENCNIQPQNSTLNNAMHSFYKGKNNERVLIHQAISHKIILYLLLLLLLRIAQWPPSSKLEINRRRHMNQKAALYEATWLCNTTLFMAFLGFRTERILIVMAHAVAVRYVEFITTNKCIQIHKWMRIIFFI